VLQLNHIKRKPGNLTYHLYRTEVKGVPNESD